jgi:hypothetical protein
MRRLSAGARRGEGGRHRHESPISRATAGKPAPHLAR